MGHTADIAADCVPPLAVLAVSIDGGDRSFRCLNLYAGAKVSRITPYPAQMDTALVLGVIGTATGVGSFAFGVVAWNVERRDRRADVAAERGLREAQEERDRQRFALERQQHAARLHAEITATQGGFTPAGEHQRNYDFVLTNLGPSWSKHVSAWLADEETGEVVSGPVGLGPIDAGHEKSTTLTMDARVAREDRSVALWVKWSDEGGLNHVERSNLHVRLN